MSTRYKIVEEWSAPTYIDHETGEVLYESCSTERQCFWVVSYDPEEHEIIEWLEQFPNKDLAMIYAEKHCLRLA